MTIKDILETFNLPEGEQVDDAYLIVLKNSDEFAKIYTKLSKSDIAVIDEDASSLDLDGSFLVYDLEEDYYIILTALFEKDEYTVQIKEDK